MILPSFDLDGAAGLVVQLVDLRDGVGRIRGHSDRAHRTPFSFLVDHTTCARPVPPGGIEAIVCRVPICWPLSANRTATGAVKLEKVANSGQNLLL
jgi:hypothetical protein